MYLCSDQTRFRNDMECVPKNEIKNHTAYKGLLESIGECEGRSIWQVNCGQFNASIGSRPLLRVNMFGLDDSEHFSR